MSVLVLEDRRLPLVVLGLTVRRGAGSVPANRAGLAVFTAELMKRGAAERDALQLARAVDDLGASLDVSAGWDSTTVSVSGLSRDLDSLFEILSDVARRPRFEDKEAKRARGEQLAGLEQAKDDPGTLLAWNTARALYGKHRYGLPMDGTPASVKRFTASKARDFHQSIFLPNDAVLFATGDVSAAAILEVARRLFDGWESGPLRVAGPPPPQPAPDGRRVVIFDRPDLVQAEIAIAHDGIARANDDRIAVALMNSVLGGGGFSSRLMDSLRAQAGLTYGVWSGFSMRRHPGPFRVQTATRVPETRRAIDMALSQVEKMRQEPPTDDELGRAKSLATGRFSLGLETSAAVMGALVDLDVYGLPEDSLDTYRGRVRATTHEDAAAMARERLHPNRAAIVVVGPAAALEPQLEGLGPIEIVEP
jgi:zinc protease